MDANYIPDVYISVIITTVEGHMVYNSASVFQAVLPCTFVCIVSLNKLT